MTLRLEALTKRFGALLAIDRAEPDLQAGA